MATPEASGGVCTGPKTIGEWLGAAAFRLATAAIDEPRREAELLMEHLLQRSRVEVYLHRNDLLPESSRFWSFVECRFRKEPLAYITRTRGFWSLDLRVEPGVFIPRRETEHVVEEALKLILGRNEPLILDVGTGSGAIALALAKERPDARVWAIDVSREALDLAALNARECGLAGRVNFLCGDLFSPLRASRIRFDLIVSNPPYIATSEWEGLDHEVKGWEPQLSLLAGENGLGFYRRLFASGLPFLEEKGGLVLEVGSTQGKEVLAMATDLGYSNVALKRDYSGFDRVLVARGGNSRG